MFTVKDIVRTDHDTMTAEELAAAVTVHDYATGALIVAPGVVVAYNGFDYGLYLIKHVDRAIHSWSSEKSLGRSSAAPGMLGAYALALVKTARKLSKSQSITRGSAVATIEAPKRTPKFTRPVSAEPTTNTPQKENAPVKKYTAVTIKNNAITYHGLFSTLAEAKDVATRFAGVPVKRAGDAYPYEGGVMVAGAHDVILKRHKAGAYTSVSTVEETKSIEDSGTIEAPAPAAEPSPTVEPGGIITTIHTGEGLNIKDRAALMTPAVQVAINAAVHPVFLKFSHYTATNRLHVAVTPDTLTPVVIDAQGIACTIDGVEPVTIGEDLTAAIARLLRVMRPLNKLVNARAANLTPAGSVSAVPVAV